MSSLYSLKLMGAGFVKGLIDLFKTMIVRVPLIFLLVPVLYIIFCDGFMTLVVLLSLLIIFTRPSLVLKDYSYFMQLIPRLVSVIGTLWLLSSVLEYVCVAIPQNLSFVRVFMLLPFVCRVEYVLFSPLVIMPALYVAEVPFARSLFVVFKQTLFGITRWYPVLLVAHTLFSFFHYGGSLYSSSYFLLYSLYMLLGALLLVSLLSTCVIISMHQYELYSTKR